MDVDASAVTTNEAVATDVESPLPIVEELPPISTLEIGESKGTITEEPRDLTPNTAFVQLEEGVLLEQVSWSPHNRSALVTAGRDHMHVFKVTANSVPENNTYSRSTRIHLPAEHYEVQAFCWTEKGSGAFTTATSRISSDGGVEMTDYKMFGFTEYGAKLTVVDESAGWVLGLKYNHDSEMLLSLSWGEPSRIKVWHYTETIYENSKRRVEATYQNKAEKVVHASLMAAAWISPERFVVAGDRTIEIYEVREDQVQLLQSLATEHYWVKLDFDPIYDMLALLDKDTHRMGTVMLQAAEAEVAERQFDYAITDFAFQPLESRPSASEVGDASHMRILATAADDGKVYLWNACQAWTLLEKLSMSYDACPQILAFSHDGFALAAAGYDTLNVWKTTDARAPKAVWRMAPGANDRWKSEDQGHDGASNGGDVGEREERFVHKLGWDADGKRIAFGMNGQVAVIRMM